MRRIGVDVGGTNTDAVLMDGRRVLATAKTRTTADVTGGIIQAMRSILTQPIPGPATPVRAVMLGTTHFVNALLQCRGLATTAVFRLCGPATRLLPPLIDWPESLKQAIGGRGHLLGGGHEFDGREISPFDEEELRAAARRALEDGVQAVAISGVFSPVNPAHEQRAAELLRAEFPGLSVSLSHEIGRIGILERENAAALNAALSPVARKTVGAIRQGVAALGIDVPVFLTQNDGTLMDADYAARYPVLAISSGPTNSMRGAALLSAMDAGIVIDIGGTSTDVGVLVRGFPREAAAAVQIAGVRTNFRMPDLVSMALGGGSIVSGEPLSIGPTSVGARITEEAQVFGGATLTLTDVAVAAGRVHIGEPDRVAKLPQELVQRVLREASRRLEDAIDRVKLSADPLPLVLVGGASFVVADRLAGTSQVIRPEHAQVANAIGAAIAQVGGEVEKVYLLERDTRQTALAAAREEAAARAIDAGADPSTVELVEVEEIPLTYLPGNAVRIRVKAVGELLSRVNVAPPR